MPETSVPLVSSAASRARSSASSTRRLLKYSTLRGRESRFYSSAHLVYLTRTQRAADRESHVGTKSGTHPRPRTRAGVLLQLSVTRSARFGPGLSDALRVEARIVAVAGVPAGLALGTRREGRGGFGGHGEVKVEERRRWLSSGELQGAAESEEHASSSQQIDERALLSWLKFARKTD